MADRDYSRTPISENSTVLDGPEAHHLIHVMRAKTGMEVVLFDGTGVEFDAEITRVGRADVELAVGDRKEIDRELPTKIVLAVALPKGDRQRWLIEKAVELGISHLVPLETTRSVVTATPQALKRLQRTVIEASKQCGRNRLMEIGLSRSWVDLVAASQEGETRVLAHPSTPSERKAVRPVTSGSVTLAIGPEGGFTEEEVSRAVDAGWQAVSLGPRILRIETAAVLLTAMVTP